MDHRLSVLACAAACLGVLAHVLYFIRGEHHQLALRYCQLAFSLPVISCASLVYFLDYQAGFAVQITAVVFSSYVVSLWTSMLVYRAFFHRLKHFPGPWYLKLSKLCHAVRLVKMDNFKHVTRWHQTYGDFVRVGKTFSFTFWQFFC